MQNHDPNELRNRLSLRLNIDSEELGIHYDFALDAFFAEGDEKGLDRPTHDHLIAVRVEALSSTGTTLAPPATKLPSASAAAAASKLEYSQVRCRAWFRLRIDGWPRGEPPPSTDACLAAARAHFTGNIGRDEFRAIRRELVPPSWRRPGPRRSRN
jgi:hypothetical protein